MAQPINGSRRSSWTCGLSCRAEPLESWWPSPPIPERAGQLQAAKPKRSETTWMLLFGKLQMHFLARMLNRVVSNDAKSITFVNHCKSDWMHNSSIMHRTSISNSKRLNSIAMHYCSNSIYTSYNSICSIYFLFVSPLITDVMLRLRINKIGAVWWNLVLSLSRITAKEKDGRFFLN